MPHPPIDQQITFLYTPDLANAVGFYEQTLGLEMVLDQGSCRIFRVTQHSFIGLCQRDDVAADVGHTSRVIVTLVTAAVDDWYHYLQGQGVVFEKAPELNPTYNIYHCFLRDPNGYLIEIQQFLDPSWPT
jgi:catechol 2,3-dioxygenase-like lactoylglutathione lyase family enzyme